MIKKIMITASIIIALFLIITAYRSQIPDLKVTQQNTKVEVLKCPFSWDTIFSHRRWDYPTPPELAKEVSAATVESQSTLDFSFSKKPERFEVSVWGEKSEEYQNTSNGIVVPDMKGTYVFTVIGHWKNGQVLYVFKIDVK